VVPQLIESWCRVRSSVVKPRILAWGRNRAIERTVNPLRDRQMIALAPISVAARCAADVMALVIESSTTSVGSRWRAASTWDQPG
jgi:hypothetical protein